MPTPLATSGATEMLALSESRVSWLSEVFPAYGVTCSTVPLLLWGITHSIELTPLLGMQVDLGHSVSLLQLWGLSGRSLSCQVSRAALMVEAPEA